MTHHTSKSKARIITNKPIVADEINDTELNAIFSVTLFLMTNIDFEKYDISTMHLKLVAYKSMLCFIMTSPEINGKSCSGAISNFTTPCRIIKLSHRFCYMDTSFHTFRAARHQQLKLLLRQKYTLLNSQIIKNYSKFLQYLVRWSIHYLFYLTVCDK